jgi:hypothetical protein
MAWRKRWFWIVVAALLFVSATTIPGLPIDQITVVGIVLAPLALGFILYEIVRARRARNEVQ